jgi:hypothetical protein
VRRLRGSEGEREGWDMNRRGQRGQREGIATRGLGLVGLWNMLGDLFGGFGFWNAPQSGCFFEVLIMGSWGISVQTLTF